MTEHFFTKWQPETAADKPTSPESLSDLLGCSDCDTTSQGVALETFLKAWRKKNTKCFYKKVSLVKHRFFLCFAVMHFGLSVWSQNFNFMQCIGVSELFNSNYKVKMYDCGGRMRIHSSKHSYCKCNLFLTDICLFICALKNLEAVIFAW